MREMLRRLLEDDGHQVEMAADAGEAVARHAEGRFSLVISDISMPGESGIELRERLSGSDPGLPVILISGALLTAGRQAAESMLRTRFLAKPFEPQALLTLVEGTPVRGRDRAEWASAQAGA